jgi:hypothetical protein
MKKLVSKEEKQNQEIERWNRRVVAARGSRSGVRAGNHQQIVRKHAEHS